MLVLGTHCTILSDISLDTHGVDVMVMPRIAVVLEVLIMAMMLSLGLMDIGQPKPTGRPAPEATVAARTIGSRGYCGHRLRIIELKYV